jgi:hypothetical protein
MNDNNEEEPYEDLDVSQYMPEELATMGRLDASTLLIDPTRRQSSPFQIICASSPKVGPTGLEPYELREEYLSPKNSSPTAAAAAAAEDATSLQFNSLLVADLEPPPSRSSSGLLNNTFLIRRHSVSPRRELAPTPVVPKLAPESVSWWHTPWSGSKPAVPPVLPVIPDVVNHSTSIIMAPPALPPAPVPQNVHSLQRVYLPEYFTISLKWLVIIYSLSRILNLAGQHIRATACHRQPACLFSMARLQLLDSRVRCQPPRRAACCVRSRSRYLCSAQRSPSVQCSCGCRAGRCRFCPWQQFSANRRSEIVMESLDLACVSQRRPRLGTAARRTLVPSFAPSLQADTLGSYGSRAAIYCVHDCV